jgi:hypothetical protein
VAPEREAWDYDVFVRRYNETARQRGGWDFDPTGREPEKLCGWYESSPLWSSLADFALTRYQLDQEI